MCRVSCAIAYYSLAVYSLDNLESLVLVNFSPTGYDNTLPAPAAKMIIAHGVLFLADETFDPRLHSFEGLIIEVALENAQLHAMPEVFEMLQDTGAGPVLDYVV
jgi:hypothetical protein